MFTYFTPQSEILKKYIDQFYKLSPRQNFPLQYSAFPMTGTCLSFFRNAIVTINGNDIIISQSAHQQITIVLLGRILTPVNVCFKDYVEEVSILFNATGINYFFEKSYLAIAPASHNIITDKRWEEMSQEIFSKKEADQLSNLERLLLSQLVVGDKKCLARIVDLFLSDETIRIRKLADEVHMSERNFLRYFKANFGCSPSEYRKIIRFRKTVNIQDCKNLLNEICFQNSYYDPSHFRRDFRKLTSGGPGVFFKTTSRIGPGKYPFKVHH